MTPKETKYMVSHANKFIIETAITKARHEAFQWVKAAEERDRAFNNVIQVLEENRENITES
jgi:acyl-CoA reductase-like NAD-dependent aldehyde dehydrogenase